MRKAIVLAAAVVGAVVALSATPSHAYRGEGYWNYRLTGARLMSYQITNAGYPARRYEGEVYYTYFPGDVCCGYRRHWPWIGRYHHGYRHWPWYGRYHRHHW
jgi:hypothetical protein